MSVAAVLLLLCSAVIHVGWNLASKRRATGQTGTAFFLLANLFQVLLLLPIPLAYGAKALHLPGALWGWLAATGFFEALYYAALAGAYQHGELSIAYPLARAIPVLLVALVNLLLGRGGQLSPQALVGMALVFTGCILLPLANPTRPRLRDYLTISMGMALAAAIGTTGYSLVDDQALRLLRAAAQPGYSPIEAALIYSFWQTISSALLLLPLTLLTRRGRQALREATRHEAAGAFWTGAGIFAAYILVLVAMAYARNISYVVAFRQTSIPLGALVGVVWLKEKPYPMKFLSIATIFSGLVLVGTG